MKFLTKKKRKIGLALGSGAAKGLAHIGVIKELENRGISIDVISGSSIGALIGACYAIKGSIKEIEALILGINWKRLAQLLDPNIVLFSKGAIYGKKIKELLRTIIGGVEFKDLKIPLSVVTTDAETGEEVILDKGSVLNAVRASISIPGIFTPVKLENRYLMDGGIINPVPVSVIKRMGSDFSIACNVVHVPKKSDGCVNVTRENNHDIGVNSGKDNKVVVNVVNKIDKWIKTNRDKFEKIQNLLKVLKIKRIKGEEIDAETPGLFESMMRALYIMEYEIIQYKIREADLIIQPDVRCISQFGFDRGREAILAGHKAVAEVFVKMNY